MSSVRRCYCFNLLFIYYQLDLYISILFWFPIESMVLLLILHMQDQIDIIYVQLHGYSIDRNCKSDFRIFENMFGIQFKYEYKGFYILKQVPSWVYSLNKKKKEGAVQLYLMKIMADFTIHKWKHRPFYFRPVPISWRKYCVLFITTFLLPYMLKVYRTATIFLL